MQRARLVVMVKEPRPGRVKTRLGRDIGMVASAWWFRAQVARLLRRIEDPRWDIVLAVSPDREGLASRVWPQHLARTPQGQGDLGARMARLLRQLGPRPVMIIGSDIPGITRRHIAKAANALGSADAVFGPACDGGYWLVGARPTRMPATFLSGVRWSGQHALSDSVATLGNRPVAYVDTLRDVDTLADLTKLSGP